jgi:nucleoside-diphosphate-sugar epimerase
MVQRILVNEAGGFIGSHLAKGLQGQNAVIPAHRSDLDLLDRLELSGCLKHSRGEAHLLSAITEMILRALGTRLPVAVESAGEDLEYSGANHRILALLPGWHPISSEDGVSRQVHWLMEQHIHLQINPAPFEMSSPE